MLNTQGGIGQKRERGRRTVDALAVPLGLAVEHGVLVAGEHLGFGGHLSLPPLDGRTLLARLGQRIAQYLNNCVDRP